MRGIERVITGVLLAVAVCGSAAFARSVGRDAAGGVAEVQLVAAPRQHAQSPRAVHVPLYPLLTDGEEPGLRKASKPSLSDVVSTPALAPARGIVVARPVVRWHSTAPSTHASIAKTHVRAAKPAPVAHPHVPKAAPAPVGAPPAATPATPFPTAPAPTTPAPTPPAPTRQSDSRILAKVRLAPAPTWDHVKGGPGRLKNHPDDDGPASPTPQPPSNSPSNPPATPSSSPTITIVLLAPGPQRGPDNGNSGGNDNGHGHAYGRLKQGQNDHD